MEDNPADVALIQATLRAHSAETVTTVARDGEEAVELLESMADCGLKPDLIFLDLNLPKRDGHEVLAFLRAHAQLRTTPVAIFTSSDRPQDRNKAYSMGADCYVLKGHDLDTFTQNVAAICSFWASGGTASFARLHRFEQGSGGDTMASFLLGFPTATVHDYTFKWGADFRRVNCLCRWAHWSG